MWKYGKVKVGHHYYNYDVKVLDHPSEGYGIKGSNIIKLAIYQDKPRKFLAVYDRGWDTVDSSQADEIMKAVDRLIAKYKDCEL